MEKEILLVAILGIILLIGIVQLIQLNGISAKLVGGVALSSSSGSQAGAIDTSQMTANEKMNYEMHGIIPERFGSSGSGASALPNMVGGC